MPHGRTHLKDLAVELVPTTHASLTLTVTLPPLMETSATDVTSHPAQRPELEEGSTALSQPGLRASWTSSLLSQ